MNIRKLIEILEAKEKEIGNGEHIAPMRLIELIYQDHNPSIPREYQGRQRMSVDVMHAKKAAGYPHTADFFMDIWPEALLALRRIRKIDRADNQRAAILLAGGEAQRDQHCVIIAEDETTCTVKPGATPLLLPDGRRIAIGDTVQLSHISVRPLP